jgi:protein SCO1/2
MRATQLDGLLPEPLPRKPTFTLVDTAGRPFPFGTATRGKLTYLYFGYTHCPNACPTTMSDIAYAVREQRPSIRRKVEVVFVTVDPRRDTRSALRAWLDHYSPTFVGLRGTEPQIMAAERAAGVPLAPPEKEKGANYAVQHASIVLAYSPDGLAHAIYTGGFHANAYAHDMPLLLAKR